MVAAAIWNFPKTNPFCQPDPSLSPSLRGSNWSYLISHSPKVRENGKYYMFSMGTLLWQRAHCKLLFRDWGRIPAGFVQSMFQQGMFFMRVSQHAKPIGGVNCEKHVSIRAFRTSNLDIFNDWWKWSTIRKRHFWASAIVCKKKKCRYGVMVFVAIPTTPTVPT